MDPSTRRTYRLSRGTQLIACLSLVIASCSGPEGRPVDVVGTWHRIPVEIGDWLRVDWLSPEQLIVEYGDLDEPPAFGLLSLDGALKQLDLPRDPDCRGTIYRNPSALESGDVLAIKECLLLTDVRSTYGLVQVELSTGDVRPFLAQPSPLWISTVSMSPNGLEAAVTIGSSLCATIGVITRDAVTLPSVVIEEGAHSWNLRDGYEECGAGVGLADWPAWSNARLGFAFFASPDSMGVEGPPRGDAPSNLYAMADPMDSAYSVVLRGIVNARALEWSPDGDLLTFGGEIDGQVGVWALDPATASLTRLTDFEALDLAWAPDGTQLAAVRDLSPDDLRTDIVVVDVPGAFA